MELTENDIASKVVNAAYEVHKSLGPGLLESVYEDCLNYELKLVGLQVERQKPLPVKYKEVRLDAGFRLDLIVNQKVIIEVKAIQTLEDVHLAQVITYLKLTNCKLGLLINFNVPLIKNGIKRIVHNL